MSKADDLYYQYRRKLNQENGTRQGYRREKSSGQGTRNERYINEVLGGQGQPVQPSQASTSAPKTRQQILQEYRNGIKKSAAPSTTSSPVYSPDGAFFPKKNPYEGTTTKRPNPLEKIPYSDPLARAFNEKTGWRDPGMQALYELAERTQDPQRKITQSSIFRSGPIAGSDIGPRSRSFEAANRAAKAEKEAAEQAAAGIQFDRSEAVKRRQSNIIPQETIESITDQYDMRPSYMRQQGNLPAAQDDRTRKALEQIYNSPIRVNQDNPVVEGFVRGTGIPSIINAGVNAVGAATGDQDMRNRMNREYAAYLQQSQQLAENNPIAYGAGNIAGNIALMSGIGKVIGAGAGAINTASTAGRAALRMGASALNFAATTAIQEAGAAAGGFTTPDNYARDVLVSGGAGMASAVASMAVAGGLEKVLSKSGLGGQYVFLDYLKNLSSATAGAGARVGVDYAAINKAPTDAFRQAFISNHPGSTEEDVQKAYVNSLRQRAGEQFVTAFVFNLISSYMDTLRSTERAHYDLQREYDELEQVMEAYGKNPPRNAAEAAQWANDVHTEAGRVRSRLNNGYYAGQQDKIDKILPLLDEIDERANQWASNYSGISGPAPSPEPTPEFVQEIGAAMQQGAENPPAVINPDKPIQAPAAREAQPSTTDLLSKIANTPMPAAEEPIVPPAVNTNVDNINAGVDESIPETAENLPTTKEKVPTTETTAPTTETTAPTTEEIAPVEKKAPQEIVQQEEKPAEKPAERTTTDMLQEIANTEYEAPAAEEAPAVEQLNDELNSPFAVFENENPEIAQIQTRTGEQKLAALAAQATENQAAQKRDQIQAIYEAGKTQNPDFQTVMDSATMLTETEKTDAFYRGLTAAAAEAAGIGKEISYGGQQQKEGNYLSGEGSRWPVSLSAGERNGSIPSAAGVPAESSWRAGKDAADPEAGTLRFTGEVPATQIFPEAEPGQVIHLVSSGTTPSVNKGGAVLKAAGAKKVTYYGSDNDIATIRGEQVRASVNLDTGEVNIRVNDPNTTAEQQSYHEAVEIGVGDGRIVVADAMKHLKSSLMDMGIDAAGADEIITKVSSLYQQGNTTPEGMAHANKEMVCDGGARINQFDGVEGYEDAAAFMQVISDILHPYCNEKLGGAFDAEAEDAPVATMEGVTPEQAKALETVNTAIDIESESANALPIQYSSKLNLSGKKTTSKKKDSSGNELTVQQEEYFKDSKIRDADGNLQVMYHGTNADFNVFDTSVSGGVNGTAEGFGIYLSDRSDVSDAYGDRLIKAYVNVTKPASSNKKTITRSTLKKLIKATAMSEAEKFVADGDYENVNDAVKDSWISNYTNTYEKSLSASLDDVANQLLRMDDNDMGIIQEVMAGMGIRDYAAAYDFYDVLKRETGFDGFETWWTNAKNQGDPARIVLAFDSNQVKNIDNLAPTENEDIRYSSRLRLDGKMVELTEREEKLMEQLSNSYLERIEQVTAQKDAQIAELKEQMKAAVGAEKQKAREQIAKIRKEKNERIAYLEKQWRQNTNWQIAELKRKAEAKRGEEHDDMIRRLAKLQAQKDKKIEEILSEHRRQRQEARDRRNDRKLRVKFQKMARKALRDAQMKPGLASERVKELLNDIDLTALGMRDATRTSLHNKLLEIMEMRKTDENYLALHAEEDWKKVERLFKKQIKDMSLEEVSDMITELSALIHYQETTDKLIRDEQNRSAAEVGRQIVSDLKELTPLDVTNPVKVLSAKFIRDNLSPERAFNRLSGYKRDSAMKTLYRQVLDGYTKVKSFEKKSAELFDGFEKDEKNKDFLQNAAKQTIPVTGKYGQTALISPAMRVSLYMASKNRDNQRHIATDGMTVPEPKAYAKGLIDDAYGRGTTIILEPTEIDKICAGMTESEKEFARLLETFFDVYAKEAINETSVDLDGVLKAIVDHYFPISSDKNFLAKSMDSFQDPTLEGWNNLKKRQEGANNKILLEDARQVLNRHIRNTARYYGLAIPLRNWNKVYGYTSHRDEFTGTRDSVQSAIKNAWNSDTAEYIERLIRDDINAGGRKAERGVMDRVRSSYAGSTLTLNAGVALKQTTSYFMAGSILDMESLMYGLSHKFTKADQEYMDSITPWGWARRQGESTIELGEMARRKDPITKNTPNWNQAMDVITTNALFTATERSIRKEYPGLKRGDTKYDEALAERYNQVLWRTQPQYEAAFRPEYLRKTDIGSRTFGMFKTESMQMSGELIDAWGQWRADEKRARSGSEQAKRQRGESAKHFYKTFASWIASNMSFAMMGTALNILLFHKGKPYRNDRGEVDWQTIATKTGMNFISSLLGGFMFASTAFDFGSYLFNIISGNKATWYDIEVPGISMINDMVTNTGDWVGTLLDEYATPAMKARATSKFALAASKFTPLGFAENLLKLADSVNLYVQDIREGIKTGDWHMYEAGDGFLQDTSPTKDQYAHQAVYYAGQGNVERAGRALKRTKKANLEKALGRKVGDTMFARFVENPQDLVSYMKTVASNGSSRAPKLSDVPEHGFSSFTKLKEGLGSPNRNENWHHIVEQEQGPGDKNFGTFTATQINNANNVVSIPSGAGSVHKAITDYYGSVQDFTDGMTVREWLAKNKSFEEQFDFGIEQLRKFGDVAPTERGWVFIPDEEKINAIPLKEGKDKELTATQKQWDTMMAEAREDGGLTDREIRAAALQMLNEGVPKDEVIELYKSKKNDKYIDEWMKYDGESGGDLSVYFDFMNAKSLGNQDGAAEYLNESGLPDDDKWALWELAGWSEKTFDKKVN